MGKLKKKPVPMLDLSGTIEVSNLNFDVNDYDYDTLQGPDPQLENDLDYLLNFNSAKNSPVTNFKSFPIETTEILVEKKKGVPKRVKVSVADVTNDMNDINLSSDSEDESEPPKSSSVPSTNGTKQLKSPKSEKKSRKSKSKLDKKKPSKLDKNEEKLDKPVLEPKEDLETSHPQDDTDTLLPSPDVEESTSTPEQIEKRRERNRKRKERRKKPSKLSNTKKDPQDSVANDESVDEIISGIVDGTLVIEEDQNHEIETKTTSELEKSTEPEKSTDLKKSTDSKKSSDLKKSTDSKNSTESEKSSEFDGSSYQIKSNGGKSAESREAQRKTSKETRDLEKPTIEELLAGKKPLSSSSPSSNLFEVKLRSTKMSTMNSKFADKLPEIHAIKTIIGLSHKQIMNLDVSDVKLKTIVSSSTISKYTSTALNFTIKHTDELFSNLETKKIFFLLCINIALYESAGFKKTAKIYPNILELFGGYDEINLENTRTKLTPSSKDIHQNNLDYSVLSFIGNILIWAVHQQRQAGVPLLTRKYDISLPATLIRENVGGYHLWDRLIREPQGMNAKRWKHITKFRQAFPYEEDQFMLILRFMKIDDEIP